ncbi:MAG: GTPase Era [Bacilli bacterium]|nr:GTPase Era [Bacilli bacterium]
MKVGVVSIVGRPNAGKSTLINSIINEKIAITSNKPQTTRNNIQGIYNDSDSQIIFVDTPGIHKPVNKLGKYLNRESYSSLEGVDLVLFMIDSSAPFGKGDEFILEKIKEENINTFLILNKVDKIKKDELFKMIMDYKDKYDFKEIIPVSALKDKNIDELLKTVKEYLPEGNKIYPEDYFTDKSVRFLVSELIREKVLRKTREEVPHAVTVVIENYEEKKDSVVINACIIVERDGIKKILVGHNGDMIKEIGIDARKDIENLVGKNVYLDLFVKTVNNWRDRDKYLIEFGFDENNFE